MTAGKTTTETHLEVCRVKVDDGGMWFTHEGLKGRGHVTAGSRREDGHQLLHGLERLRVLLKVDLQVGDAHKIRGERSVVVREIPGREGGEENEEKMMLGLARDVRYDSWFQYKGRQ